MDRERGEALQRIQRMLWVVQEKESGHYLSVPLMNSVPREYIEMSSDQLLEEIKAEVESLVGSGCLRCE